MRRNSDDRKFALIAERRIARLEKALKKESMKTGKEYLLGALEEGAIDTEALCEELISSISEDLAMRVAETLDLVEDWDDDEYDWDDDEDMEDMDEACKHERRMCKKERRSCSR